MNIPRSEYPRPQMVRDNWTCLNGAWQFEIDNGCSGRARGLVEAPTLSGSIILPFCPESKLSGVGNTDFMNAVWYKRTVSLKKPVGRLLLHVDASDYATEVWVNGQSCGVHYGSSTPIAHDITDKVVEGDNLITVCAEDNTRSGCQPLGKQSGDYHSAGCHYTRITGIWQSVWLEEVPAAYVAAVKYTPDAANGRVTCEITCVGADGMTLTVDTAYEGTPTGSAQAAVRGTLARLTVNLTEKHLWEVGCGRLYDLTLTLGDDTVKSYFGLRDVHYDGRWLVINGEKVFQRLVLDQGYYPDGLWTAPDDSELEGDIDRSLAMGFNGARLHQKVFEPRFLYHCDRKGYIVWGELGNWGLDLSRPTAWAGYLPEWLDILTRDYSHPAIIGWCPLNETEKNQDDRLVHMLYDMTKAYDPYRAFIDCSGWCHRKTEIVDAHTYEGNPDTLQEGLAPLTEGKSPLFPDWIEKKPIDPALSFISEYGGIAWNKDENAWGYGNVPATPEEFLARLKGLTDVLIDNPCITGFCYTQLTDVEQEQNGLYTYDRKPKFDPAVIAPIFSRPKP